MTARCLAAALLLAGPPPVPRVPPPPARVCYATLVGDPREIPGRPGHYRVTARPLDRAYPVEVEAGPATCVGNLDRRYGRVRDLLGGMAVRLTSRGGLATEVLVVGRDPWAP